MLLNTTASLIWQHVFLMILAAKTEVQHLRASFTEALSWAKTFRLILQEQESEGFDLFLTQKQHPTKSLVQNCFADQNCSAAVSLVRSRMYFEVQNACLPEITRL